MKTKAPKMIIVITLALVVVMLIGQWYAYVSPPQHNSHVELNGNEISYSVDSEGVREYKAVLFDNADYVPMEKVYLYYDEEYASNVDENTSPPIGSPSYTQSYFIEQMEHFLPYRGMDQIERVDAERSKALMEEQIASGTCRGKGILLASGSIPDILFSGDSGDLLPTWVDNGGTLYWVGNEIGRYVSNGDEMIEINGTVALTGVADATFSDSNLTKDQSILREELSLLVFDTEYAIDGTGVEHFGFFDGSYSTVSCIGKGFGQICIVSGKFCMNLNKDLSNVICSGLSYKTSLIGYDAQEFTDHAEGRMTVPATHGKLSFYIYIGSYHSIYGERYDL